MATETIPKGEYYIDRGTGKMELHFDKASYLALPEDLRHDIKSYFLFSRNKGAWISKGQADSWAPKNIAEKLGFKKAGETGEKVSFAEQMEAKAERAAERAERYSGYSASAHIRASELAKDFNRFHEAGDIAFFTQPGRLPFRDKVFARYERSFGEEKKAAHFAEQAERLQKAATQAQLKSPRYLDNRIKESEAKLRSIGRYAEEIKQKGGTAPESLEERATAELDKLMFYKKAMEAIGGAKYSQTNVQKGDQVLTRFGWGAIRSTGPKNMKVETGHGFALTLPYAEIKDHKGQKTAEPPKAEPKQEVKLLAPPKPTPEAKEPWKMTKKEMVETAEAALSVQGKDVPKDYAKKTRKWHEDEVKQALKEGKPVPAEVLKDYPELGKKPRTLGAEVPDIGSQEKPVLSSYGLPAYRKDGFWYFRGYSSPAWARVTDPRSQEAYDNLYPNKEAITKAQGEAKALLEQKTAKPEPKAEGKGPEKPSREYDRLLVHLGGSNRLLARQREAFQRAKIPVDIVGSIGTGHWSNMFAVMPDTPEARTLLKQVKGSVMRKQWSHLKAKAEAKPPEAKAAEKVEPKPKKERKPLLGGPVPFQTAKPQSDRAIAIDRALLAKQVVQVDDPRWLARPNRFDVRGIDTPGSGRVVSRTGFTDRGKTRMSRKHHRGWKRIKL